MHKFKDNNGKEWCLSLTVGSVRRVRDIAGVDLLDSSENGGLIKIATDPIALTDAIYAACKPDADAAGVSQDQFCDAMFGDCIEQATAAMIEAVTDFIPNPKDRENLRALMRQRNQTLEKGREKIASLIANGSLDTDIDAELNRLLTAGNTSGNSQAQSA